jgi:phage gp29-like protein
MFVLCLRAYLDVIASTMNREAVQKLFELNKTEFPDSKYIPRLTYSGLEKNDVDVAINALATAVEKGVVIPTAEIQEEVLDRLDMPGHEAKVAFKKQEKLQEELIKQSLKQGEEGQGNSPTPKSGGNAVSKVTGG